MRLQPVVEGHGEVEAAPVLLRRLVEVAREQAIMSHLHRWNVRIGKPIRRPRGRLVRRDGIGDALRLAVLNRSDAILILFDSDNDCPATLGPRVQEWATEPVGNIPCEVVLVNREYESWFLASIESLRGIHGIRQDACSHRAPEAPRGAKAHLEARMRLGLSYVETSDQSALSGAFSMKDAFCHCRSFRKLTSAFGTLLDKTNQGIRPWPPEEWESGS